MTPRRLPPLPAGAVSLDDARTLGLADHDWRDARLLRVTRSVRSLHAPLDLRERARAFARALPADCAFSHVTAARLWGLPLPAPLERDDTLDVMRRSERAPVERTGCRGHRGLERRRVVELDGLRVTDPADTWVDLAAVRRHRLDRDDLVAVGDAVVTRWARPGVRRSAVEVADALDPLRRALAARGSPRGATLLVEALALVRPGVRSARETRSRLLFVAAGFPEPEPCAPLHARGGGWLAEGDLVWHAQRVVGEYQGEVHGSRSARSTDAARNGLLGDEDWTVLEIFAEDHADPHRRRALLVRFARALGLDPRTLTIR
ncbi:hypothetical protein [Phycicoccus sonneratiae]|uniref:Transcriptional regulator, AbiEi antitoxin, Type IV TA system n=1 Tax=Phycicoccus sonneratiae TaxID=2807628 RepID=A0ABS2CL53_9MICO|nr:hypothetical protein [Phycicoccus sonneraticus]MBM6400622.1 hypothetical protein [Phycicoccus sonneraticus]